VPAAGGPAYRPPVFTDDGPELIHRAALATRFADLRAELAMEVVEGGIPPRLLPLYLDGAPELAVGLYDAYAARDMLLCHAVVAARWGLTVVHVSPDISARDRVAKECIEPYLRRRPGHGYNIDHSIGRWCFTGGERPGRIELVSAASSNRSWVPRGDVLLVDANTHAAGLWVATMDSIRACMPRAYVLAAGPMSHTTWLARRWGLKYVEPNPVPPGPGGV
jgi:hypothetical protein